MANKLKLTPGAHPGRLKKSDPDYENYFEITKNMNI